ncbi:SDR family NAD(P)-dependent oxidoreductase [Novosphingobium sp. TH158]|uniref:SDR family NAD(P)-dependent oxidoreductase n=1 Tax=Novosphingobium sp. TH158 TaxID=2067455 RepID=UPI000C79881F|nr:SDR family NAD(P)-dependent oxidoreductase [Novosphingobium sp. TH158]PLK27524.1 alcohol dehydrogenase [Novosphingobium sp. TH158]
MANKVALVTGAQAGIGAACAKRLARDGVAVGVLDLKAELCADTVQAIRDAGGEAIALGADISNRAEVKAAVQQLRETFGPITIVVNNAGVTDFVPFEEINEDRWEVVYKINVLGQIIVTQEVLPDMKAKGWGRVVMISSSSAQTGAVGMTTYSGSKGAVVTMTKTLAQELGPLGITVNNIPPGSVMGTIMSEANRHRFPIPEQQLLQAIPVGRMGEPNDIANACAWLCHEDTGYVNGQTIGVNGGRVVS